MPEELDAVFKALADPTRRLLLDRLRRTDGQTLTELCDRLGMARQSVTQHLAVLESAALVTTVRRGREKLHYLNPVPIHALSERWIGTFDRPRLAALSTVKQRAQATLEATVSDPSTSSAASAPSTARPTFVYVTYIEATPERVWHALTDADLTARYWGHANVSDWEKGSTWEHVRTDGSGIADVVGRVVESEPPHRLVSTWSTPGADPDDPADQSRVTFQIEPFGPIVRLTVTHENLSVDDRAEVAHGWPAVLSNLKSLLETGRVLPVAPWETER